MWHGAGNELNKIYRSRYVERSNRWPTPRHCGWGKGSVTEIKKIINPYDDTKKKLSFYIDQQRA